MTQLSLSPSNKKRKSDAMSCDADGGTEIACLCPRCDAHRQRLERRQQLYALYALPIYQLPPELILTILDKLDLIVFPAMIIGMFHLLRHHGIAPLMTSFDLKRFLKCSNPDGPPRSKDDVSHNDPKGFYRLPMEIRLDVYKHLSARDKINFVLATFEIPIDDIESLTHWRSSPIPKTCNQPVREESKGAES